MNVIDPFGNRISFNERIEAAGGIAMMNTPRQPTHIRGKNIPFAGCNGAICGAILGLILGCVFCPSIPDLKFGMGGGGPDSPVVPFAVGMCCGSPFGAFVGALVAMGMAIARPAPPSETSGPATQTLPTGACALSAETQSKVSSEPPALGLTGQEGSELRQVRAKRRRRASRREGEGSV